LKIKEGKKAVLAGQTVVITRLNSGGGSICWWTPSNNNVYYGPDKLGPFEYLYGSTCGEATIDAPTNVAVNGNILTFDAVTGAKSYDANIYLNGTIVKTINNITSGTELTRLMQTGATFQITIVTQGEGITSIESAAADWVVADEQLTIGSSEYCDFGIGNNDNERAVMTWQTDAEGNINITISGDDATWRGTAFKGINFFKVGLFPASEFFEEDYTQGDTKYTLRLKDATKKPVVGETIQFKGTYQWRTANNGNAYAENVTFTYTYGSACGGLAAPTNVQISNDSIITFDAVTGADTYTAYVYLGDILKYEQIVNSGDKLHLYPYVDGNYIVNIIASGEGKTNSDPSADFTWTLSAREVKIGASEYCGKIMRAGTNEEAAFTWVTTNDGSIVVSIAATLSEDTTSFRPANGGMTLTDFKIGEGKTIASVYFNHSFATDKITLTLKDPLKAPAFGEKIYFNAPVRYATRLAPDAYPTLSFEYTYGSNCTDEEAPVMVSAEVESHNYESAIINVTATDNKGVTEYRVVDTTNGIDQTLTATAGQITINGLSDNTTYNFTITAFDAVGNESNSIVVTLNIPFNTTKNLALNKPYGFGYENAHNTANNANDGSINSQWTTYGNDLGADAEWWYVDLGDIYSLNNITITWGNPTPTTYILQTRVSEPSEADKSDDAAWVTVATITDAVSNAEKSTNISSVGRYVRFHSLAKNGDCIRMKEFCVYGTGRMTELDTKKPIMVDVTLVSVDSKNAVLSVEASDNIGIAKFHIIDANNGIDLTMPAENGQIKLTGLTSGTTYNFIITAIDLYGNVSENDKVIEVTTTSYAIEPTTAAPVPTWPAELVMSLYSDSYDFAPAEFGTYQATWYNRPTMTRKTIDGNEYLYYDLDRDGVIGWEFSSTSIITMEKLHIDIWSSINGSIAIRPITTGGTVVRKTLTLVAGQWNSFDIDLAEFGTQDWNQLNQFGIDQYNAGGLVGDYIAIDNVYFYSNPSVTTTVDGWATFAFAETMQAPVGLKVYKATYSRTVSEDILALTELSDGIIPAGEGVLIYGATTTTYGFTTTNATPATDMSDNDLIGTTTLTDVSAQRATSDIFCLRRTELFGTTAFCLYSGQYIPAGKAYLALPKLNNTSDTQRKVRFVFNTATGIEDTNANEVIMEKFIQDGQIFIRRGEAIYNIQGVRVQ
jgi:hypothetical protein